MRLPEGPVGVGDLAPDGVEHGLLAVDGGRGLRDDAAVQPELRELLGAERVDDHLGFHVVGRARQVEPGIDRRAHAAPDVGRHREITHLGAERLEARPWTFQVALRREVDLGDERRLGVRNEASSASAATMRAWASSRAASVARKRLTASR